MTIKQAKLMSTNREIADFVGSTHNGTQGLWREMNYIYGLKQ